MEKAWAETPNLSSGKGQSSQIPSNRRPGLTRDAAKDLIDCDSGSSGDESQEDSAYNVGENSAGKNLFNDKLDEIYDAVIDE